MASISSRFNQWQEQYPTLFFLGKLAGIFLVIFYSMEFIIAVTAPGGSFYLPFADLYFDLDHWFSDFLLGSAGILVSIFGYATEISGNRLIIGDSSSVIMGYSCLGFGVLSAWIALILAYPNRGKQKVKYQFLLTGSLVIVLLNILRIALLAMIWHRLDIAARSIDHHLIFNLVVYAFIFLGFRWYVRRG